MSKSGTQYDYLYINRFDGGINKNDSPLQIADNELRTAKNAVLTTRGAIAKRKGYKKDISATAGTAIDNIYRYYFSNQKQTIVATRAAGNFNKIYKRGSSSWTEITGGSNLLKGRDVNFSVYRDTLFIYDGAVWQYYTGSGNKADVGFDGAGLTLTPKLMEISDNRIFVVDSTSTESNTLYYSAYNGWTASVPSDLDFGTNDNLYIPERISDSRGIVQIKSYGLNDELLVFRENDIWALSGVSSDDYQLLKVTGNAGCVAKNGIAETDYGSLVFPGVDQIYELNGSELTPIGNQIIPLIKGVDLKKATSVYDPRIQSVIIGYPQGTLVWNTRSRAWTTWDIPFKKLIRYTASSDYGKIVFCLSGDNHLYEWNQTNQDDSSTIDFEMETKIFDYNQFAENKTIRGLKTTCDTYTLSPFSYEIRINDGTDTLSGNMTIDKTGSLYGKAYFDQDKWYGGSLSVAGTGLEDSYRGNMFSVKITASHSNDLTIYNMAVESRFTGRRREQ